MKYFRHFTDAHVGTSIQTLMNKFGHTGLVYWIIVEMCAEKLTYNRQNGVTEGDCKFVFHERIFRERCRLSGTNVARMLDQCATLGLLSWTKVDSELHIEMPKLLEYLDKDQRRARTSVTSGAQKRAEEEEKEKEEEDYAAAAAKKNSVLKKHNSRKKKSPASQPVIFYGEKLNPIAPELAARNVRSQMAAQWVEKFGAEIILEEFWKAVDWAENSGKVKSFGAFFSNWLKRTAGAKKNEVVILPPRDLSNLKGWEE